MASDSGCETDLPVCKHRPAHRRKDPEERASYRLGGDAYDRTFVLSAPYPFKGTLEQKKSVVREALLHLPLVLHVKQFMALGNDLQASMRKAATVAGERSYDAATLRHLSRLRLNSVCLTLAYE